MNIVFVQCANGEIYSMVTQHGTKEASQAELDSEHEMVIALVSEENLTTKVLESLCDISNTEEDSFLNQLEALFAKIFGAGEDNGFREGVQNGLQTGIEMEKKAKEAAEKTLQTTY